MRITYLLYFFIIGLFCSQALCATTFSCTPAETKIQNKNIILPGLVSTSQSFQIYFLHNVSRRGLWLDHPVEGRESLKAGWSSFFQPGKWSAILINKKDFSLSCATIEPGKVNYQECSKAIIVCMPKGVKYDTKRKGSFWLAEDKTYDDLIAALEKRGVHFPKLEEPKKVKVDTKTQKENAKPKSKPEVKHPRKLDD